MAHNGNRLPVERRPITLDQHELDSASDRADWRAATTGLELADFECAHGRIGLCVDCEAGR